MNCLNLRVHGALDYLTVVFLVALGACGVFSAYFSHLLIALGVIHLVLTVLSAFPSGIVKILPMKIHGYVELVVSIALLPAPYLLGYAAETPARYFTWAFAVVVFGLYLLTDYAGAATAKK